MKQHILIFVILLIGAALIVPAYSNTQTAALLLQQTPANGGRVTPATGVHKFEPDSEVTLTALPNPGYQFVYWLGDVSDPTSTSTVVYLDSPKIIIAIFERSEHQFAEMQEFIAASGGRGGAGRRSRGDYSRSGGGGGIGPKPRKWQWPSRPEPPEDDTKDDLPVPDESNETDIPVPENEPVPEPATGLLLIMGSLIAIRKRRKRI